MAPDAKVLVIGGGIGGLALGVALSRAGIECEVFERDQTARTVGAGLVLHTSPMRALQALGIDGLAIAAGCELVDATLWSAGGRLIQHMNVAFLRNEFGQPTIGLHRLALHTILRDALGAAPLHMGKRLVKYVDHGDEVVAHFQDGTSARGAVLVGADGMRSVVRRQLLNDGPPRFAGYSTYRGTTVAGPRLITGVSQWLGRGRRFGGAPVGNGEIYWFAPFEATEGEVNHDPKAHLIELYRHFASPVPEVIAATREDCILRTDIHDRDPVAKWSAGRVTLLGDAAHPTTPNLGQGAGMALEDAVVLSRHLSGGSDVSAACRQYEADRMSHAAKVVLASRTMGRIGQLRGAMTTRVRDLALGAVPISKLEHQLRDLAVSGMRHLG